MRSARTLTLHPLALFLHFPSNMQQANDYLGPNATHHYSDVIPGGRHWSMRLRRGVALALMAQSPGANVGMLFYNPENPLERLNLPDTLKCQHTFRLTQGHCLYSDMGRIFASIVADDLGWHDASGGTCNKALVDEKWGHTSYQEHRNEYIRSGRDSFLIELGKYGLGSRDLTGNINWFSRVNVDDQGRLTLDPNHAPAGSKVVLRFEMDTLVILHTCPHPLNNSPSYPRHDVEYSLYTVPPPAADDDCRMLCQENQRGFKNTELLYLGA